MIANDRWEDRRVDYPAPAFHTQSLLLRGNAIENDLGHVRDFHVAQLAIDRAPAEDVGLARHADQVILGRRGDALGRHAGRIDSPPFRPRVPAAHAMASGRTDGPAE